MKALVIIAIGTVLRTVLVSGNIIGQTIQKGTCLCAVNDDEVKAYEYKDGTLRYSDDINLMLLGDLCAKFHGGANSVIAKNNTYWYQLDDLIAKFPHVWVNGQLLEVRSSSHCSRFTGHPQCNNGRDKFIACALKSIADTRSITFWNQHMEPGHADNATAYDNIRDACNGDPAYRSDYTCPECESHTHGGQVCLNANVISYIFALVHEIGQIHVNEIAGGCHKCTNKNYLGSAVELHSQSQIQTSTMIRVCRNMAGSGKNEGGQVYCEFASEHVCTDNTARDYACKLLKLAKAGNITLWNVHPSKEIDNAFAYNNINDACYGQMASRSNYTCTECSKPGAPGGYVCLNATMLQYIIAVHERLGHIHVNEVAGACHSCTSKHYLGRAVDLDKKSQTETDIMISICRNMTGVGIDEKTHVHCQFNP